VIGLVIKELTYPYSVTHKDYNKKKRMRLFCVGFPRERERERKEKENFFLNFLKNWGGVFIG